MPDSQLGPAVPAHAEPGRLAELRRYEILDAPEDGAFSRVAELAAAVFTAPIGLVSIVDEDRVWFAARHGLDGVREVGVEPGLCTSVVLQDDPYVIADAAADPRALDHPLVRGELGLRFYAAAPIITPSGHRLGTVSAIDRAPREAAPEQLRMLALLAGVVAEHLELRLAALLAARTEQGLRAAILERATPHASPGGVAHDGTGPQPETCQLGGAQPCRAPAELKVADSQGVSAWGCLDHVEEVLIHVGSVFLTDQQRTGLTNYMRN